jgi:hypothetical protein
MRWWMLTAAAAFLLGVGAVVLLLRARAPRPVVRCSALGVPELRPPTAGFTVTMAPSVQVKVDGVSVSGAVRVVAGRHRVEASVLGRGSLVLELDLAPFSPATLDVRADGPSLLGLVLGARCTSCEASAVDVALSVEPGPYSLDASAAALSHGDWRSAVAELRHVPEAERHTARFDRQLAVALALAGQPTRHPTLRGLMTAMDARRREEDVLERRWQVARWNEVTTRFTRLAVRFANKADPLVRAAGQRMDSVSAEYSAANEREGAVLLRAAEETLATLAAALVALHPLDCAWIEQVNAALAEQG